MNEFKDVLAYLRRRADLSQADLAASLGLSKSAISMYERGQRKPSYEILEAVADYFNIDIGLLMGRGGNMIPAGFEPLPSFRHVPIVGAIACGQPILADENIQGQADMPEHVHADFALRCKGDSMIDARIHDGDLVFIRKQPVVENGEIAAVRIDDEVTLKRWTRQGSTVILQPANALYAPMAFSGPDLQRLHVEGKAVAFISPL